MEDSQTEETTQLQQSTQTPEVRACPQCGTGIPATAYFCPHCGRKIKDPPPSTSIWGQIKVYAFSILLPPFGLIPAIRYLRQPDGKSKVIGMVIIILTLISFIITTIYAVQFINSFNAELTKQLGTVQFGY